MYITAYKTDGSATSMRKAGHPKPVLWDNPEEWGGEGGSGWGDTCIPVPDSR